MLSSMISKQNIFETFTYSAPSSSINGCSYTDNAKKNGGKTTVHISLLLKGSLS